MADNYNPIAGFRPMPDAKGTINTGDRSYPISSSNGSVLAIGSPVAISGGELSAVATYSDGSEKVSGVVVRLLTDSGKSVLSVPASTDGYRAEITVDAGQRFIVTMDGTGFTDADAGKMYSLTAETLTASPDGFTGEGFSRRQLATSTEASSGEQFIVHGRSAAIRNPAGVDNVEVVCSINPENFVQA